MHRPAFKGPPAHPAFPLPGLTSFLMFRSTSSLFFPSFAFHCCFGFTLSLYWILVRDALYASTRPLLEQRLTRARRQLLIRVHCSRVYHGPFLSCKMLENGYSMHSMLRSIWSELYAHMFDWETFVPTDYGINVGHIMHDVCIDQHSKGLFLFSRHRARRAMAIIC